MYEEGEIFTQDTEKATIVPKQKAAKHGDADPQE